MSSTCAVGIEQPRRARAAPGGSDSSSGSSSSVTRCCSPGDRRGSRPSVEQRARCAPGRPEASAAARARRARPPPARRRARMRQRRPRRPSPRAPRRELGREREVQGAQLLVADHAASAGCSSRRSPARDRFFAAAASSGCDGAHAIAVDDAGRRRRPPPRRGRVRDRRELATVRSALSATASSSRRTGAGKRADARAEHVLDRVGHRKVLAGRRAARARPACGPTSSANSGLPSVESTMRRSSGRGRLSPSRSSRSWRVAPRLSGPTSRRSSSRRSKRPLERRRTRPGRLASRKRTGSSSSRRAANVSTSARRRVEPLHVVDRDQQRLPRGQRAQQRSGSRARSHAAPAADRRLGAQQRDLERADAAAPAARRALGLDLVEQVDERREREPRLGAARPRREHREAPPRSPQRCRPPRASSCRSPARRPAPTPASRPRLRGTRAAGQARALARSVSRGRL